jgi:guanyl-specific ribonuclease Sa
MSIGGDYFGNYEGLLPEGKYRECDIDYDGGYRGEERLIYTTQGDLYIYYTDDHYESFELIYAEGE